MCFFTTNRPSPCRFVVRRIFVSKFLTKKLSFRLTSGCTKDIQVVFKSAKPIQLNKEKILCTITKITFDRPINEVPDWDDRMRSIKWIDVAPSANESEQSRSSRPARKKVIEADVEPAHQRIEDQTRQLDIYISATVDFCRYKCSDFEIRFLDTAMLQTRIHEFV